MPTLSVSEIADVNASLTVSNYAEAYRKVADYAEGRAGVDQKVIIWLRGAADVNEGVGAYSDFIRGYTQAQMLARYGESGSSVETKIQSASDDIAETVLSAITSTGNLPSLTEVADDDAQPAAEVLFNDDAGGWAGNPLFVGLGLTAPFQNNILEPNGGAYDALAMIKFMLTSSSVSTAMGAMFTLIGNGLGTAQSAFDNAQDAYGELEDFLSDVYGPAGSVTGAGLAAIASDIILGRIDAGDDLEGDQHRNFIHGGGGNDTLQGSAGEDVLDGGAGIDVVTYEFTSGAIEATVAISTHDGQKTVALVDKGGVDQWVFNAEALVGSTSDDRFKIHDPNGADGLVLSGAGGDDTLEVTQAATINQITEELEIGGETLTIQSFENFIGGAGADTIIVRHDVKSIDGGGGKDTADFSLATAGVVAGPSGPVELLNIEVVHGSDHQDQITGDDNSNRIFGRDGSDQLIGGGGIDVLDGGEGVDELTGGAGADFFVVGQGDTVWDPTANDVMGVSLTSSIRGVAKREEGSDDPYEGMGYQFEEENGTLHVSQGGNVIAIVQNWTDGDLGIRLEEEEEEEEEDEDPPWEEPVTPPPIDPLVLDLDGDGLEFVSVQRSTANFDLNEDGFRERVGWIRPDDGFLIRDANTNGVVDGHSEMFGTDGLNSYEMMAPLDTNSNGKLDAGDAAFSSLRIWRDLNQDGASQAGELTTLEDQGIASVSVNGTNAGEAVLGIGIIARSTFERVDGSDGDTASVLLSRKTTLSLWEPPSGFEVSADAALLPELRGYGTVKNLSAEMTLDSGLLAQAQGLVTGLATMTAGQAKTAFESLLLAWTGADDAVSGSRGAHVDAGHLEVIEAMTGTPYVQRIGSSTTPNPNVPEGERLEAFYDRIVDASFVRFLVQASSAHAALNETPLDFSGTPLAVVGGLIYDKPTDDLAWSPEAIAEALQTGAPSQPVALQQHYAAGLSLLRTAVMGDDTGQAQELARLILPHLSGLSITSRVELIEDSLGVAIAAGGPGDDDLTANGDLGLFLGGAGNDTSEGSILRDDTYYYDLGDGADRIIDTGYQDQGLFNTDRLVFGPGITPEMVELELAELGQGRRSVVLTFAGQSGSITLEDQLQPERRHGVEFIEFANGEVWDRAFLEAHFLEASATAGDDIIVGTSGDDTLAGLQGDDLLEGGRGGDRYEYSLGDGDDLIDEASISGTDVLAFGAGITPANLILAKAEHGVRISFAGQAGSVTIADQSLGQRSGIEFINFAGGESWTGQDLIANYFAFVSTPGDDFIEGFRFPQTLQGGTGNDTLFGDEGEDLYVYNIGDGHDLILDEEDWFGPSGALLLGAGIAPTDVALRRNVDGDLILEFAQGGSVRLPNQFENDYGGVNEVRFDGGLIWDRDDLSDLYLQNAGTPGDDLIVGLDGDDTLIGGQGDDTLVGAGPNGGADSYLYDLGDGDDVIDDSPDDDGPNRLVLGPDIDPEKIVYSRVNSDLILTFEDGGSITLARQFDTYYGIEEIEFRDQTVIEEDDFLTLVNTASPGNDTLTGDQDDNTLTGGGGDDLLIGGRGEDTYLYASGDGDDVIREDDFDDGDDVLEFTEGVDPGDLVVARDGDDAVLTFANGVGSIRLENQFLRGEPYLRAGVEEIVFSDASNWSRAELQRHYLASAATSGNDNIVGFNLGWEVNGVREGEDTFTGGQGDDTLTGYGGEDTYNFAAGDGDDVIDDRGGSNGEGGGGGGDDRLVLGGGIDPEDLSVTRVGDDAILTLGNGDTIRLLGQFALDEDGQTAGDGIEEIVFDNAITWSRGDIYAAYLENAGSSGPDTLIGADGAETLTGAGGDDRLEGGLGEDRYVWRRGDGDDVIFEATRDSEDDQDIDTIAFGPGVMPSDVTVTREGNDARVSVSGDAGSILIRNHFFRTTFEATGRGIETFAFDGGATWTRSQIDGTLADDDYGTEEADTLAGTNGVDHVWGDDGDDSLSGGAGDDVLAGESGADVIDGGDGVDTVVFSSLRRLEISVAEDGSIEIQDSDDYDGDTTPTDILRNVEYLDFADDGARVALADLVGTLGTGGDDTLAGTSGADTLYGAAGQDSLSGLGGSDIINGGADADALNGGEGADELYGDAGADTLSGGGGDDYLDGGEGDDTFSVGAADGEVYISDWEGQNVLKLAAGLGPEDVTLSRENDDLILTVGSNGAQVVVSGFFYVEDGAYLGVGIEKVVFANALEWDRDDILAAYLEDASTSGDDSIVGGLGADTIAAQLGDDTISGGNGGDAYLWNLGDGNDVILEVTQSAAEDPAQVDTIRFGPGVDPGDVTVTRQGIDALVTIAGDPGSILIKGHFYRPSDATANFGVETFAFDGGPTWTRAQIDDGLTDDDELLGSGDESFAGGTASDVIWGGAGDDTLLGGQGDDILAGEDGADSIDGGAGVDRVALRSYDSFYVAEGEDGEALVTDHTDPDYGADALKNVEFLIFADSGGIVRLGSSLSDSVVSSALGDEIYGLGGADSILGGNGQDYLLGGTGNDTIVGGTGEDGLEGGDGSDEISAGAGDDWLAGGEGNDTLAGGDDDDEIYGDVGGDLLVGGAGKDSFRFGWGAGHDVVDDFDEDEGDIIDVSGFEISSFSDLLEMSSQVGSNIVIDIDGESSITLKDRALASLKEAGFQFYI